jgi:hypothetical protein
MNGGGGEARARTRKGRERKGKRGERKRRWERKEGNERRKMGVGEKIRINRDGTKKEGW